MLVHREVVSGLIPDSIAYYFTPLRKQRRKVVRATPSPHHLTVVLAACTVVEVRPTSRMGRGLFASRPIVPTEHLCIYEGRYYGSREALDASRKSRGAGAGAAAALASGSSSDKNGRASFGSSSGLCIVLPPLLPASCSPPSPCTVPHRCKPPPEPSTPPAPRPTCCCARCASSGGAVHHPMLVSPTGGGGTVDICRR
eukprot:COSAG02_NODE_597_length_19775_cov_28.914312_9_plen_198_part_00